MIVVMMLVAAIMLLPGLCLLALIIGAMLTSSNKKISYADSIVPVLEANSAYLPKSGVAEIGALATGPAALLNTVGYQPKAYLNSALQDRHATPVHKQIAAQVITVPERLGPEEIFEWVECDVKDHQVALTGAVRTESRKQAYAEIAWSLPGVEKVVNDLRVLPALKQDDRLRQTAADRIYNDSLLEKYARRAQPRIPISLLIMADREVDYE